MREIFSCDEKMYRKVVLCCCLLAFGTIGIPNSYGLFYGPLSIHLNTSFGPTTLHMAISTLACGLVSPIIAQALRQIKLNYIILSGAILALFSAVIIATTHSVLLVYLMAVIRGIGYGCCSLLVITFVIGFWFEEKRGKVLTFVLSSAAISGALFSPVIALLINTIGIEKTYIIIAVIIFICSIPMMRNVPLKPRDIALKPYGKHNDDTVLVSAQCYDIELDPSKRLYWYIIFASTIMCCLPVIYLPCYAKTHQFTNVHAAFLISYCMIGNLMAKIVFQKGNKKLGLEKTLYILLSSTIVGLIIMNLCQNHLLLAALGTMLYGCSFALSSVGVSTLVHQIYGNDQYVQAYTDVSLYTSLLSALTMALLGFSYDLLKSFQIQIILFILLSTYAIYLIHRIFSISSIITKR